MIIKRNQASGIRIILQDNTDFKTLETGVLEGSVTVEYAKNGESSFTTKVMSGSWTEIGSGIYEIAFTASELDTSGVFTFLVTVPGILPYPGEVEIRDNTNDDIGLDTDDIIDKTDLIPASPATEGKQDMIIAKTNLLPADPASDANVDSVEVMIMAELSNGTYGLSAIKMLVESIDTATEMSARFDDIKGIGWTSETLKSIFESIVAKNRPYASFD